MLCAAIAATLSFPAAAEGHGLKHAQLLAAQTWGDPCPGALEVRTEHMEPLGRAYLRPPEMHGTPEFCVMSLRDGWWKWSWPTLQATVCHEYGHLWGREHSENPRSIMFPRLTEHARHTNVCVTRRKGRAGTAARVRRSGVSESYWHRRHVRAHAQVRYHRAKRDWPMVRRRKAQAQRAHQVLARARGCSSSGGTPAQNQRLGKCMAAAKGWAGRQWSCLRTLWHGESGWRNDARNASSHAGGIPQALPARKMGLGRWPHYVRKVRGQIAWGLRYIARRYGSPCGALAFWRSKSPHWY